MSDEDCIVWELLTQNDFRYVDDLSLLTLKCSARAFQDLPFRGEKLIPLAFQHLRNCSAEYVFWLSSLQFPLGEEYAAVIAETGNIEILKALEKEGYLINNLASICAAGNGHSETLAWLQGHMRRSHLGKREVISAIRYGHLDVVKWLYKRCKLDSDVIDYTGDCGSVEIFEFLKSKYCCCTERIFTRAYNNGQSQFIDWLKECGYKPRVYLPYIAKHGHVRLFAHLFEKKPDMVEYKEAMNNNHLEDLKWMVDKFGWPEDLDFERALMRGTSEMKAYLTEQGMTLKINCRSIKEAIRMNDLKFLEHHAEEIASIEDCPCCYVDDSLYDLAIRKGRVRILEHFLSQGRELKHGISKALKHHQPEVLKFLVEKQGLTFKKMRRFELEEVMDMSATGKSEMRKWLSKNGRTIDASYKKIEHVERHKRMNAYILLLQA